MDLFNLLESFDLTNVVDDSRAYVRSHNPIEPEETREDYNLRIFWLTNDEIERRILISGKKRPDYSNQNFFTKNKKKLLTY